MTQTVETATHDPVELVVGDLFCIEGQCDHMPDEDEVGAVEGATCPMLDEVTVCGSCSTVTSSEYGDEWGPVVNWPCTKVEVA
jgi:hypothetical protein